jgi:lysophospholipase L1-like esterase
MKSFRRLLRVLGLLLVVGHTSPFCEAQTAPTRILPLGDSLTSGTTFQGAYRNQLYTLLTNAGYNVDFIGTETDTSNPTLPDRDHQGMGGFRIHQIQSGINTWLGQIEDPDVILLMIGTNDFSANFNVATAQDRLASLVGDLAARRPFAKIIVSSLLLRTDDANLEALQSVYNAAIPGIVSDLAAQGHQVSFVDMHAALEPADFEEGVHPSSAGYAKMANTWFPAITSVISPTGTSNSPAMVRTQQVDAQNLKLTFSKPLADSAASPANFAFTGGVAVTQAVLDATTKRTLTLTTSPQTPGTLYTITASNVRDRTPQANLIAAGASLPYAPQTLVNGSFDAGQSGWNMSGNFLVFDSSDPYLASDGSAMLVLNGAQTAPNAVVSQSFSTVPGQTYVLDYDIGILALNGAAQVLGVDVSGTANLLTRTETVFGNSLGNSVWSPKSHTFTADGTSATLTIRDLSLTGDGLDLLLDHVRVTPVRNNLLANGSFEGGQTVWTFDGNFLVYTAEAPYTSLDGYNILVFNGGQTPPNAVVSQTFATVPGESYQLDLNVGTYSLNFATQKLGIELTGAANLLTRTENLAGTNQPSAIWGSRSYAFIADSTATTLTLRDLSATSDGIDLLVENVRVVSTMAPTTTPTNTAPVATGESYSTPQDTALTVNAPGVLGNDSDAQSDPLTAVLDAAPANGALLLNPNGSFTYTPNSGYSGTDSFSYHANDGMLDSAIVTVSLTIVPTSTELLVNGSFESGFNGWTASGNQLVEDLPGTDGIRRLAFNSRNLTPNGVLTQSFATLPGQTYTLSFDVGVLSYVKKQQKIEAKLTGSGTLLTQSVTLSGKGDGSTQWSVRSFTFTANSGTTTLSFRDRSSTTVGIDLLLDKVRVTGPPTVPPTAPTAAADIYFTNAATPLNVTSPGVLGNDSPQNGTLSAVLDSPPANGGVIFNASGGFYYTPAGGFSGTDSFTYRAVSGNLSSGAVTVTIQVNPPSPSLLTNPSFESNFDGWTATGSQSIEFYAPTDGSRVVAFNSQNRTPDAVLSQTFTTIPGRTYNIAFDAGLLSYTSDSQTLQVSATGNASLLSQNITLTGSGVISWFPQAFSFVADSASTTLSFRDLSTATVGIDLLIDHVRLTLAPAPLAQTIVLPPLTEPLPSPSISLDSGNPVIRMTAPRAGEYILERSPDLLNWEAIDSTNCDADTPIEFQDNPAAATAPQKMFYRIGLRQN